MFHRQIQFISGLKPLFSTYFPHDHMLADAHFPAPGFSAWARHSPVAHMEQPQATCLLIWSWPYVCVCVIMCMYVYICVCVFMCIYVCVLEKTPCKKFNQQVQCCILGIYCHQAQQGRIGPSHGPPWYKTLPILWSKCVFKPLFLGGVY